MIIFYVLCLLYVLSTATVVCDFLSTALAVYANGVSKNSICNLKNMFFISYAGCTISYWGCTITSAWNCHDASAVNVISPSVCPNHSSWLLWRHCPIYLGTLNMIVIRFIKLYSLSTDDLPGVAGAGVPKYLKLRRARRRSSPPGGKHCFGGEKISAHSGRLGWACVRTC